MNGLITNLMNLIGFAVSIKKIVFGADLLIAIILLSVLNDCEATTFDSGSVSFTNWTDTCFLTSTVRPLVTGAS